MTVYSVPKIYESWLTLLDADKVRKHVPILDIARQLWNNKIPNGLYHRQCRSIFKMKRDLETLKGKASENQVDDSEK